MLDSVSADPCGFCVVLTPALVFLIPFLSGEGVGWRVSGWYHGWAKAPCKKSNYIISYVRL